MYRGEYDRAGPVSQDALSAAEKEEFFAYAKAGTLLSILKSKARRTQGIRLETRDIV